MKEPRDRAENQRYRVTIIPPSTTGFLQEPDKFGEPGKFGAVLSLFRDNGEKRVFLDKQLKFEMNKESKASEALQRELELPWGFPWEAARLSQELEAAKACVKHTIKYIEWFEREGHLDFPEGGVSEGSSGSSSSLPSLVSAGSSGGEKSAKVDFEMVAKNIKRLAKKQWKSPETPEAGTYYEHMLQSDERRREAMMQHIEAKWPDFPPEFDESEYERKIQVQLACEMATWPEDLVQELKDGLSDNGPDESEHPLVQEMKTCLKKAFEYSERGPSEDTDIEAIIARAEQHFAEMELVD